MRITINYFEGYPELEAELAKYSPRARAERLRLLAAMGLAYLHLDGRIAQPATGAAPQQAEKQRPIAQSTTKPQKPGSDVAKKITKGIFGQME